MYHKLPRIILADPDPSSCRAMRRTLESAGYNVETAANGSEIVIVCEFDPPDILIMDVHLPDMDGFDVCSHVRHEAGLDDLTIIVTTECTDEMTREYLGPMVEYSGGDFFIVKPCDGKLLLQLLEDLSSGSKRRARKTKNAFQASASLPRMCRYDSPAISR